VARIEVIAAIAGLNKIVPFYANVLKLIERNPGTACTCLPQTVKNIHL
jgi:hypothetical protein